MEEFFKPIGAILFIFIMFVLPLLLETSWFKKTNFYFFIKENQFRILILFLLCFLIFVIVNLLIEIVDPNEKYGGITCADGWVSFSEIGPGICSHHGGLR